MRDRQRLELKPDEYRDAKAAERRKLLGELLSMLERARREPWYVETLDLCDRLRRGLRPRGESSEQAALEPEPAPPEDSPFRIPAAALPPEPEPEPESLFT